MLTINLIYRSS